jgi:hypothetical protein
MWALYSFQLCSLIDFSYVSLMESSHSKITRGAEKVKGYFI